MENNNINLLDLNNDILNIIGRYVKEDNKERIENEEIKKVFFNFVDKEMKFMRKVRKVQKRKVGRADARLCIYSFFCKYYDIYFGKRDVYDEKEFDKRFKLIDELNEEYLTLKKLNLKKK
jgi:hypothetical protein